MDADLLTAEDDEVELKGSTIIAAIKASGVEFILSVPDIVTSGGLLRPISRDPAFKLIRVCKEDETSASPPASRIATGAHSR